MTTGSEVGKRPKARFADAGPRLGTGSRASSGVFIGKVSVSEQEIEKPSLILLLGVAEMCKGLQ